MINVAVIEFPQIDSILYTITWNSDIESASKPFLPHPSSSSSFAPYRHRSLSWWFDRQWKNNGMNKHHTLQSFDCNILPNVFAHSKIMCVCYTFIYLVYARLRLSVNLSRWIDCYAYIYACGLMCLVCMRAACTNDSFTISKQKCTDENLFARSN